MLERFHPLKNVLGKERAQRNSMVVVLDTPSSPIGSSEPNLPPGLSSDINLTFSPGQQKRIDTKGLFPRKWELSEEIGLTLQKKRKGFVAKGQGKLKEIKVKGGSENSAVEAFAKELANSRELLEDPDFRSEIVYTEGASLYRHIEKVIVPASRLIRA